jgi:hypothetical protein
MVELDALGDELAEEEEIPSYLQDTASVPMNNPEDKESSKTSIQLDEYGLPIAQ